MQPEIKTITAKTLVGHQLSMSITQNLTGKLWSGFAPLIKDLANKVSSDKISLQVYPPDYFKEFNPNTRFEKWALVEVSEFPQPSENLKHFSLLGGKYAVFQYKGPAANASIFQYIYQDWLPKSAYQLDDRPHFEVLGDKYSNTSPDSEEEIWIPICEKS